MESATAAETDTDRCTAELYACSMCQDSPLTQLRCTVLQCDGSTGTGDCDNLDFVGGGSNSYMSWTTTPEGNWSKPVKIFGVRMQCPPPLQLHQRCSVASSYTHYSQLQQLPPLLTATATAHSYCLLKDYVGSDTNFAPLILPNGSFVGMWRHWGGGNGGSRMFLATGADWKDPSSYTQHHTELFPDLGSCGTLLCARV